MVNEKIDRRNCVFLTGALESGRKGKDFLQKRKKSWRCLKDQATFTFALRNICSNH